MITPDPASTAGRAARRDARLASAVGTDRQVACVRCGESDPVVIVTGRRVVESHHVAGRDADPKLTAPLCRNCHGKATETLARIGVPMHYPNGPGVLDSLTAVLAGAGKLLVDVGSALIGWAQWITELVRALDGRFPDWRDVLTSLPNHRDLTPKHLRCGI